LKLTGLLKLSSSSFCSKLLQGYSTWSTNFSAPSTLER